jgi:hypothetical protein
VTSVMVVVIGFSARLQVSCVKFHGISITDFTRKFSQQWKLSQSNVVLYHDPEINDAREVNLCLA